MSPRAILSMRAGILLLMLAVTPAITTFGAETKRLVTEGPMGGMVYEGVRVMSVTDKGLKIMHDGGLATVPFAALPKEWQEKYPRKEAAPAPTPIPATAPATAPTLPVMPAPAAAPGLPAPSPGDKVNAFDPTAVVFIKTDSGKGSGFIARSNGRAYVYTNAHVLCGTPRSFTKKIESIVTAAGTKIPVPFELELADHYDASSPSGLEDLARFPVTLKEGETAYEIASVDPSNFTTQNVVAYGNSLGGDVITSLPGTIVGLGNDRLEISCEIVPGNSGGPVVLADSRKVVGVSTYLTDGRLDIWSATTKFSSVRRFATRPDKVTKWRRMQYTGLMSSIGELRAFDRDTLSLAAACYLNPRGNRGGFDLPGISYGDYSLKDVLMQGTQHTLGSTIVNGISRVNGRLGGARGTVAISGVVPVFQEFFSTVASASSAQVTSLKAGERAPYLKQFIPDMIEMRQTIHEQFVKESERFR